MTTPPHVQVGITAHRISPLLAGHPAQVQSAVLAELLSIWLACHTITGDPKATDDLRETLLAGHIELVRKLLPINAAWMDDKLASTKAFRSGSGDHRPDAH